MKKVAYLSIIAVGMVVDFVIVSVADVIGFRGQNGRKCAGVVE